MLRTELIRPLPELLKEHAITSGSKCAYRDALRQVSYGELEQRTGRLAAHLVALRLGPGDRAAIVLGNCVEMIESYYGSRTSCCELRGVPGVADVILLWDGQV